MPELTEAEIRAIHKTEERTQALSNMLLGLNGNDGLCKRIEVFMYDADKRIRRLEIILGSVILVFGSGFGIFQLVS